MSFAGLALFHRPVLPEAEVGGAGDYWAGPEWVQPGGVPEVQDGQLCLWCS